MYAVIKTGGKQYRVSEGDVLRVEKLSAEAGDVVAFEDVLMIGGEGDDLIAGSGIMTGGAGADQFVGDTVAGEVTDFVSGEDMIVFQLSPADVANATAEIAAQTDGSYMIRAFVSGNQVASILSTNAVVASDVQFLELVSGTGGAAA